MVTMESTDAPHTMPNTSFMPPTPRFAKTIARKVGFRKALEAGTDTPTSKNIPSIGKMVAPK